MSSIPQLERLFRPLVMDLLTCGASEKEIKRAMEDADIRRRACEILVGKRLQRTDRSEVFHLQIDRALPLRDLMSRAGFVFAEPFFVRFADTIHDDPTVLPSRASYALIKLGRLLTPEDAAALIKAMGYVPAGLRELLAFIERPPPFYQRKENVIAFGTTFEWERQKYSRTHVPSFHTNKKPERSRRHAGKEHFWLELRNRSGIRSNCLVRAA